MHKKRSSNLKIKNPAGLLCFGSLCAASVAAFAAGEDAPVLESVVVSASRSEQRILDTAASINIVNAQQIHDGQAEQNLSEPLARTPGIFALNRQNYAQDMLISSRGFGANSTFGARGIKIYVDGIPGTVADGQSQVSHIDLPSADHIEVMRGPFSVLYGNSAGGVISVFTENGKPGAEVTPYASAGSYGQHKVGVKFDGDQHGVNYVVDAGALHTDGYRDHSAADRKNENVKLGFALGENTSITVIGNNVNLTAQDPLGLTAAQLASNSRAAGTSAVSYDTRKTVDQTQGGVVLTQRVGVDDSLVLSPYVGHRHIVQFLPTGTPGTGVIDLTRDFYGADGRWLHRGQVGAMPLKVVTGIESDKNDDHRLGYVNSAGVQGSSANQEYTMDARSLDEYVQGELRPNDRLALTAGVRRSETTLSSINNRATTSSPSPGSNTYQATTGMASIQYYVQERTNIYLSVGSGFDTPTLNQVFYSPAYVYAHNTGPNLGNIQLAAARTRQVEVGVKSELSSTAEVAVALFDASTSNDIVIASSYQGKTAFGNAPKTNRQGLELSSRIQLPYHLQFALAATVLSAEVGESYRQNNGSTPTNGTLIRSGNRIPGVPNKGLFGELMWRNPNKSLEFAVEGRASGNMAANDLNGGYAGGYGVMNLRAVARQQSGPWTVSEFARVDNIFDRAFVGSVIVNQASSQFYESAPGRNWLAGVKGTYKF